MANEVKVQSGVALGMKIGCGLLLFFVILTGGTCVACGACAAVGAAGGAHSMLEDMQRRRETAASHRSDVTFTKTMLKGRTITYEVTNGTGVAITRAAARAIGSQRDGGEAFREEFIVVNPYGDSLAAGKTRSYSTEITDAGVGAVSVELTLTELELLEAARTH